LPRVEATAPAPGRRALFSWCLFDWANSPFPTVVVTFVFAAYFSQGIVGDAVRGMAMWGYAMAASGLAVAFLGPLCGAVADTGGRRKPWLAVCSIVTMAGACALWYAAPDPSNAIWVLVCVAVANGAFELGMVFYNAMLPALAARERIGRLSGWGWALGYGGGLACLAIALFGFVQADPPPFGLDAAQAEEVRIVAPLAALWFAAFGWPLFVFVADPPRTGKPFARVFGEGVALLAGTLRGWREIRPILRFLIARMLYTDGLNTLFFFGGMYASDTFGMPLERVLLFGIMLNVTAGLGAAGFAWVDDFLGAKRTLVIVLTGLIVTTTAAIAAPDEAWLWAAALGLGIFVGPAQSASRSMMARMAPPGRHAEMFGLYALSGRVTAFAGPLLVGWITLVTGSQRAGMAVIIVFLLAGLALLLPLPEPVADPGRSGGAQGTAE
jgi:UMF1 family MFS transporter